MADQMAGGLKADCKLGLTTVRRQSQCFGVWRLVPYHYQRLRRLATARTAAYYVGTRRLHLLKSIYIVGQKLSLLFL